MQEPLIQARLNRLLLGVLTDEVKPGEVAWCRRHAVAVH